MRRACLYRFAPSTSAYGRAYHPRWPGADGENGDGLEDLTESERAVLQPPFHPRLDRLTLGDDGEVTTQSRAGFKKDHDAKVFGSKYF